MVRFLILFLLSNTALAGPYAGMTVEYDNYKPFCGFVDRFCTTAKGFAGYDGNVSDNVFYKAQISYESRIDDSGLFEPTDLSVTIIKRW